MLALLLNAAIPLHELYDVDFLGEGFVLVCYMTLANHIAGAETLRDPVLPSIRRTECCIGRLSDALQRDCQCCGRALAPKHCCSNCSLSLQLYRER